MENVIGIIVIIAAAVAVTIVAIRNRMGRQVTKSYYKDEQKTGRLEEKFADMGPFEYKVYRGERAKGDKYRHTIWYPLLKERAGIAARAKLSVSDTDTKRSLKDGYSFPAVVILNAGHTSCDKFEPIFEHLASWGFVVIGNDDKNADNGASGIESLRRLFVLDRDKKSQLYGLIDTEMIGISGKAQGAVGAVNAVTAYEAGKYFKSLHTYSLPGRETLESFKWKCDVGNVRIPHFLVAGTKKADSKEVCPLEDMERMLEKTGRPGVLARRRDSDFGDLLTKGDAYMTAWFLWTLKNDETAAKVFSLDDPELYENQDWQDVRIEYEYDCDEDNDSVENNQNIDNHEGDEDYKDDTYN